MKLNTEIKIWEENKDSKTDKSKKEKILLETYPKLYINFSMSKIDQKIYLMYRILIKTNKKIPKHLNKRKFQKQHQDIYFYAHQMKWS